MFNADSCDPPCYISLSIGLKTAMFFPEKCESSIKASCHRSVQLQFTSRAPGFVRLRSSEPLHVVTSRIVRFSELAEECAASLEPLENVTVIIFRLFVYLQRIALSL